MRRLKHFCLAVLLLCSIATLSGCMYVDNRDWNDLSAEEKQETAQELHLALEQALKEIKSDLAEDFSEDDFADAFALSILDRISSF